MHHDEGQCVKAKNAKKVAEKLFRIWADRYLVTMRHLDYGEIGKIRGGVARDNGNQPRRHLYMINAVVPYMKKRHLERS